MKFLSVIISLHTVSPRYSRSMKKDSCLSGPVDIIYRIYKPLIVSRTESRADASDEVSRDCL
jgi:hypothetical protein